MLKFIESCHSIANLIYPLKCISCHRFTPSSEKNFQLCPRCQRTVQKNTPPFCQKCSRPLESPESLICKICQYAAFHFDHSWGASVYNDAMKRLLHLFKYGHKTALRHFFLNLMEGFCTTYRVPLNEFDCLLPVPLHKARLRERGFNQSQILTQMLSEKYFIPSLNNHLLRIRPTQNQALLSPKQRWTNVKAAFKIRHSHVFNKKNILVVDDLYTTGATTSEIARLLKDAGARRVEVFTLAIAK